MNVFGCQWVMHLQWLDKIVTISDNTMNLHFKMCFSTIELIWINEVYFYNGLGNGS